MSTTFKPRTFTVKIYQGDQQAELLLLAQRIEQARAREKSAGPLLGGEVAESVTLTEQHNALVEEAEAGAVSVTLQALPRRRWRDLIAEHPPREGNDEDQAVGVDESTFPDVLVPVSVAEIEPRQQDVQGFLDMLSDAQFGELYQVAFYLNRAVGDAPKALSAPSPSSSGTGS